MAHKYCLITVFDYAGTLSKIGTPRSLLGMIKDVERACYVAHVLCNIPRRNITIITDIVNVRSIGFLSDEPSDGDFPTIIRLIYPSINIVVESMLKFVNKISYLERGKNRKAELFCYFSGHGVTFNDPREEAKGKKTSCIILIDNTGRERRYLAKGELLDIFHNRFKPDDLGMVTIPIIQRKLLPRTYSTEYIYSASNITVNSGNTDAPNVGTDILFLYDACQSGALPGLKYRYMQGNMFELVFEEEMDIPLSVGISATNDMQEAPSCMDGSPFTSQICSFIERAKEDKEKLNVRKIHSDIYKNLHPLLVKRCSPTVSISIPSLSVEAPIINSSA